MDLLGLRLLCYFAMDVRVAVRVKVSAVLVVGVCVPNQPSWQALEIMAMFAGYQPTNHLQQLFDKKASFAQGSTTTTTMTTSSEEGSTSTATSTATATTEPKKKKQRVHSNITSFMLA